MGFSRTAAAAFLSLLFLPGAGSAGAPADGTGPARTATRPEAFLCPDLARTELFRTKGLGYVHTLAFAEAVSAVAHGESPFAPPPVPERWREDSSAWLMHLMTHEAGILPRSMRLPPGDGFSSEETPCDPHLLYKSSLEYRSRPGNGSAGVLYPYYVPMAAHELEELILPHSARAGRIAAKIELAERMGAAVCAPALADAAKAALDRARRDAADRHYDAAFLEPSFADAERLADALSDSSRVAAAQGFPCAARN